LDVITTQETRKRSERITIPQHTVEIGVDEAGRGSLAGPLYAAAVYLPEDFDTSGIRDSKTLSARQREVIYKRIMVAHEAGEALVGIGVATVEVIERVNVLQATMEAMHVALQAIETKPLAAVHSILIDGNYFRSVASETTPPRANVRTIVRGDALHDCIAAASIVAKVARDGWMRETAEKEFPEYGFAQHKGYATRQHREAIRQFGTCKLHRTLFVRNVLAKNLV
jgi:ribonuclease HII